MCADVQSSSAQIVEVQSQSELKRRVASRAPQVMEYVKEKPLVGWCLPTGKLEDVPEAIRAQLGGADNTTYSSSFLARNKGTIIALQMDAAKPDFYIINKAAYLAHYEKLGADEALRENPALVSWISAQPGLSAAFEAQKHMLQGARKADPVKMMKLSDLGYTVDQSVTIQSPWGEQTKPAGKEGFLAQDVTSAEYYLINQNDAGNPLNYVPLR